MKTKRGATYLEYAMLLGLVGLIGAIGLKYYGEKSKAFFVDLGDKTAEVSPSAKK